MKKNMRAFNKSLGELTLVMLSWALAKAIYTVYVSRLHIDNFAAPEMLTQTIITSLIGWILTPIGYGLIFYVAYRAIRKYKGTIKDGIFIGLVGSLIGSFGTMLIALLIFIIWPIDMSSVGQGLLGTAFETTPIIMHLGLVAGNLLVLPFVAGFSILVGVLAGHAANKKT